MAPKKTDEEKVEKEEPKAQEDKPAKGGENLSADVESAQKPYPHGSPPDPEDEFEKIHGFRRST